MSDLNISVMHSPRGKMFALFLRIDEKNVVNSEKQEGYFSWEFRDSDFVNTEEQIFFLKWMYYTQIYLFYYVTYLQYLIVAGLAAQLPVSLINVSMVTLTSSFCVLNVTILHILGLGNTSFKHTGSWMWFISCSLLQEMVPCISSQHVNTILLQFLPYQG